MGPQRLAWPSADGLPRTVDFGWLLTVEADDANGDPLSGAAVNVFDNSGNPVFSGVTDASGQLADISVVTTIYQQSATDLSDTTTQACGPFQVQVSLAGYATSTQTINLTQSTTAQFQLSPLALGSGRRAEQFQGTASVSPVSASLFPCAAEQKRHTECAESIEIRACVSQRLGSRASHAAGPQDGPPDKRPLRLRHRRVHALGVCQANGPPGSGLLRRGVLGRTGESGLASGAAMSAVVAPLLAGGLSAVVVEAPRV